MISNILTRIFGSRNERLLKQYAQVVRQVNALEPAVAALSDDALRGKTAEFKGRVAGGETLDAVLPEAFAVVREAGKRVLSMRHFDVQLIGGMALHNGKIAEMRTGEGKTLVATLPAYLNALAGNGVHIVTVNDYLAQRDADWMGRIYRFLGLTVGVNLSQMSHDGEAGRVRRRHHVRHQQRIRLRLPARQHGVRDRRARAARAHLRDRRRGGLDPDRRGAHAAHHLGPGRRQRRDVLPAERTRAQAQAAGRREGPGRLLGRRKGASGAAVGGRPRARGRHPRAGGTDPAGIRALRRAEHLADAPPVRGAARAVALPPRPALRRAERRSRHRRRVHRSPDVGPALVRRPAPGGRGQGRRADPAREPDARVDHVPELLPHVRQAGRHDGHRGHRGLRVPADLPPRNGRHPDAPADGAQGRERPRVPHVPGEGRRDHRRRQGLPRARPAGARRHDVDRELRTPVAVPDEGEAAARGAQREAARARGRDRRAGRQVEGDHDRDEHGRPRHGHRAGRHARAADPQAARRRVAAAGGEGTRDREDAQPTGRSGTTTSSRPAACTSSAPSATSRGASTTSCAAVRAGRAIRVRRASTCRSRIRCCASSAASGSASSCRS